jgi:GDP-L-fucose synthase
VVVVAAAKVGGIHANATYPADFLLDNLNIQNHVIEAAWRSGVRRLLFLGSSCIYPKFAAQPIVEEALLTGALEPTNQWYAIAKIAGLKLCEALRQQHGFDAISLMPTNLYGPGDNYHPTGSHVLPALIRRFHEARDAGAPTVTCWGTGTPMREFLHVDDLAEAAVFALEHWDPSAPGAPRGLGPAGEDLGPLNHLNVGTGVDVTIREAAETVARVVGYSGTIVWDSSQPDGTPRKLLDVSRLGALGWRARIGLAEGLASTYADFAGQLDRNRDLVRL